MSCAVAGLGVRAREVLIPALAALGITVRQVCDTDPRREEDFLLLRDRGLIHPAASFGTALPDDLSRFDLGVVAASHDAHFGLVRELATAGCRVVKEKPLGRTLDEAERIVHEYGRTVLVLVERPYLAPFRRAAELLREIGPVGQYEITCWRTDWHYLDTWRNDAIRAGGGVIIDLGYHVLDIATRLFGRVRSVTARKRTPRAARPGYRVDEDVIVQLVHEGGSEGRISLSRIADEYVELYRVAGSSGTMELTKSSISVHRDGHRVDHRTYDSDPLGQAITALRNALALMRNPTRTMAESRHGLDVMTTIAHAYDSLDS